MALSPRITAKQTQNLALTPELRQAIELLQMSSNELQRFVDQELEQNPLLEGEVAEETQADAPKEIEAPVLVDRQFANVPQTPSRPASDDFARQTENIARETTLRAHLLEQVPLVTHSPKQRRLAEILVDELDSDGYLRTPLFDMAERLGASIEDLTDALEAVQTCEPTGIAARNLGECFRLQLADRGRLSAKMDQFLSRIDCLAQPKPKGIWKEIGIDEATYAELLSEIRLLNPAPGKAFENDSISYAVPDVFVGRNNLGGWSVDLNNSLLPTVHINTSLAETVAAEGRAETNYVNSHSKRAQWLIRSIEQRSATILRVAAEIVRVQEAFFSIGFSGLQPLTMKDVADKLDINESTVSRVVNAKYLHCDRGIFEFKFFFVSAIKSVSGEMLHSSVSVQEKIRKMIDNEAHNKVLSDDKIAELLSIQGIDIARRTVSKYREAMKIPASVERRRLKSNLEQS